MADCPGRQELRKPQQERPSIDDRVRRSIEYLRHTSRLGTEDGLAVLPRKRLHGSFPAPGSSCAALVSQQGHERLQQEQREDPVAYLSRIDVHATQRQHCQKDMVPLVQHQQHQPQPRAGEMQRRGRVMLIIDVQSRKGAVEEVHCREGDNCFDLARGFIERHGLSVQHVRAVGIQIQTKVRETGHQVDVNGTCWASRAEINYPAVGEQLQHDFCNHARGHGGQHDPGPEDEGGQNRREWLRNDRDDTGITNGIGRKNTNRQRSTSVVNSLQEDRRGHERRQWSAGERRRDRRRRSWQGYYSTDEDDQYWSSSYSGDLDQERDSLAGSPIGSDEDHGSDLQAALPPPTPSASQPPESARRADDDRGSTSPTDDDWRFDLVDPNEWGSRCRENGRAVLGDEYEEEEKAFRRVRASWSTTSLAMGRAAGGGNSASRERGSRGHRCLKPSVQAAENRRDGDARLPWGPEQRHMSATSCARATAEGNLRTRGRHQQRRPYQYRRHKSQTTPWSPGMMRRAGRGGGWGRVGGGGGGSEEEFGGWCSAPEDSHGGVGGSRRKPHSVTRGVGGNVGTGADWRSRGALGRRPASREAARQLRVSERMHRLAQTMSKKKEKARRRRDDLQQARHALVCSGRLNLCSKTRELTDNQPKYIYRRQRVSSPKGGVAGEENTGVREEGGNSGASYRDVGDRLYSEWKEARRRHSLRQRAEQEPASSEGWSCPQCGAENRAQDDTCQTVTGIAVAAQKLRPDTWCRESPERLGRMAATAAAAAGSVRRDGGGRNGRKSRRIGDDGLRRCGRPRPQMFKPTTVARVDDGVVRSRPKGEMLYDSLYRNPPTPSRRRANQILNAETMATCTFTPAINEQSRRLAETQEARRMLLDFARGGAESDDEVEGNGGSSTMMTPGNSIRDGNDGGGGGGWVTGERQMARAPSKVMAKAQQLYDEHAVNEHRKERRRQEHLSRSCPFTPDIGMSAAWPIKEATTEEFVQRLHDEHFQQERRRLAKRYMLHGAPYNAVDPASGQPLFSPRINQTRRPRRRSETDAGGTQGGWFLRKSTAAARRERPVQGRGCGEHEGGMGGGDDLPIHASLWERGLALEKRREADARCREEARKARASAGHVNGRSAELVQAMRVRTLVQTYRTLLASVEYARLPEGLDYDEAMESITSKINAIFDNENDAWQEMTLEVAKADPSVLKPELVEVVTSALAGHAEETLGLVDFCELLDASVENLLSEGGPTAHLFASGAGRSAAGAGRAAAAAAAKAEWEESAELKEMTFRPRICRKSAAIAKTMGRDGTKTIEDILRREHTKSERRRSNLLRQREDQFSKQHPFHPTLFSYPSFSTHGRGGRSRNAPRYSNEIAADQAAAMVAAEEAEKDGMVRLKAELDGRGGGSDGCGSGGTG